MRETRIWQTPSLEGYVGLSQTVQAFRLVVEIPLILEIKYLQMLRFGRKWMKC